MITADSSVLVPAILASHEFHHPCRVAATELTASIGHAVVETYAVLTRLPHPYRVSAEQAAEAIDGYLGEVLVLPGIELRGALSRFVAARAVGGASYDALIGITAAHHAATLLTRDRRAADIYERVGASVRWVTTH